MNQDTLTKPCTQCGTLFEGESWKKLCYPCWRKSKNGKPPEGKVYVYPSGNTASESAFNREAAALKSELATAQQDVRRLTNQLDRVTAQLAMAQAEVARSRMGRHRTTDSTLSKEMLRFLKQRCHPDKCNDASMANNVMQWLNHL